MRALVITGLLALTPATCRPIVTEPDTHRCIVWVAEGAPTGDVEPPCSINVVGMSRRDCDHAGGRPVEWGCEGVDC